MSPRDVYARRDLRLAVLSGLYVAVVLSAQIGANKIIRLPFTHLQAPGGVYSIGVALALVQLAHHTGATRRDGALNAQLLIGLGFVGSAGASPPIDSAIFLILAFGSSGLHFFDGQLVGKIASSVVIGIPLVVLGRRFLPAKTGDIVPA